MTLHVSAEAISGKQFSHHPEKGDKIDELEGFLRAAKPSLLPFRWE